MKTILIAAAAVGASLFIGTANADVIPAGDIVFSYRETSASVPGAVSTGLLAVNPVIYRTTGVHIAISSLLDPTTNLDLLGTGLDVLQFSAGYAGIQVLTADVALGVAPPPSNFYFGQACPWPGLAFEVCGEWDVSLDIPAFGLPSGTIDDVTLGDDFSFNLFPTLAGEG